MNTQSPLFFDSIEEVLTHVVTLLGGAKRVGVEMRKDMSPDAAGRWLKDALNGSRRETLHPGHLMFILKMANEAGIHDAMRWIASDCGYTTPDPVSPPDEMAELQRQFIAASKSMQKMTDRMEALAGSVQWAQFSTEKRRA